MKEYKYRDDENDYSEDETIIEEKEDKTDYYELEVKFREQLKDIFYNVIEPYLENIFEKELFHKMDKYSEDRFIGFFLENSSYFKYLELNQIK